MNNCVPQFAGLLTDSGSSVRALASAVTLSRARAAPIRASTPHCTPCSCALEGNAARPLVRSLVSSIPEQAELNKKADRAAVKLAVDPSLRAIVEG